MKVGLDKRLRPAAIAALFAMAFVGMGLNHADAAAPASNKAKPVATKAWLGIAFQDVAAEAVPPPLQAKAPGGVVRVVQVFKGTSADQAGLQVDDYILAINGQELNGRKTLLDSIHAHGVGDVVTLILGRSDKRQIQKMALSPKPEDMTSLTKSLLGSVAPDLEGAYYQGDAGLLAKNKGKVILLDFWATWCGPCRRTLPELDAVYQAYQDKGVVVIGVSSETRPELEAFQKSSPVSYPLFQDVAQLTTRKYQAFAYPTLVLIDKQGTVQRVEVGAHGRQDIERWVKELL